MTLAEQARKRAELMKKAEPLLPELLPYVVGSMLHKYLRAGASGGGSDSAAVGWGSVE
jgi:hypothetical protein